MRDYREMSFGERPMAAMKTFSDLNPADGSVWAEIPDMNRQDARAAIDKAQAAFPEWSALPFNKRAHYMIKVAEALEKRQLEIAEALVGEGGGWFGKGMFEAGFTQTPVAISNSSQAADKTSLRRAPVSSSRAIAVALALPASIRGRSTAIRSRNSSGFRYRVRRCS